MAKTNAVALSAFLCHVNSRVAAACLPLAGEIYPRRLVHAAKSLQPLILQQAGKHA